MRTIAKDPGAVYFDRVSLLCNPEHRCTLLDNNLKHLLYDYGHTTMRGAKHVAPRLLSDEKFVAFVSPPTRSSQGPPPGRERRRVKPKPS
jgi:hypothetical protein